MRAAHSRCRPLTALLFCPAKRCRICATFALGLRFALCSAGWMLGPAASVFTHLTDASRVCGVSVGENLNMSRQLLLAWPQVFQIAALPPARRLDDRHMRPQLPTSAAPGPVDQAPCPRVDIAIRLRESICTPRATRADGQTVGDLPLPRLVSIATGAEPTAAGRMLRPSRHFPRSGPKEFDNGTDWRRVERDAR